jgi:hypothetical protein
MTQARCHRVELARLVGVLLIVERADMQLVDGKFVPRGEMEVVPLPVKVRVVDDGVADRTGHLAGIGVDALEFALVRGQHELVFIADMSLCYISVPGAVFIGLQGMSVAVPSVERPDDGYPLRMGRPDTERDTPRVRDSPHAIDPCFIAHWNILSASSLPV